MAKVPRVLGQFGREMTDAGKKLTNNMAERLDSNSGGASRFAELTTDTDGAAARGVADWLPDGATARLQSSSIPRMTRKTPRELSDEEGRRKLAEEEQTRRAKEWLDDREAKLTTPRTGIPRMTTSSGTPPDDKTEWKPVDTYPEKKEKYEKMTDEQLSEEIKNLDRNTTNAVPGKEIDKYLILRDLQSTNPNLPAIDDKANPLGPKRDDDERPGRGGKRSGIF